MQISFLLSNRLDGIKRKNLLIGCPFTLLFPDGRKWTNDYYDGYASVISPDGKTCNIFALFAVWNRRQLIEKDVNMTFSSREKNIIDKFYDKTISDDYFTGLVESGDNLANEVLEKIGRYCFGANEYLDKPLKLVEKNDGPFVCYGELPPTKLDPKQGWAEFV